VVAVAAVVLVGSAAPVKASDADGAEPRVVNGTLQAVGRAGIPEGATAAVVNLTAVSPAADGFLTAFPCGSEPPGTSSVNYLAGEIVANLALVPLAPDGSICVYSYAATDVVVDVTAFVAP
jgi:hypothetical protein